MLVCAHLVWLGVALPTAASADTGANRICNSQQQLVCTTYVPSTHLWLDSVCVDGSPADRADPSWSCGSFANRAQQCPMGSHIDVNHWQTDAAGNVDESSLRCTAFPWTMLAGFTSARIHAQTAGTASCRTFAVGDPLATVSVPPATVSGPFVVSDAANGEAFVAGADARVYHTYMTAAGVWSTWDSLSGPSGGIFGAVRSGTNYRGQQELYVRGNNGQVYHLYSTPGKGSGWQGWDTLGSPSTKIRGDVYEQTNYLHNQELYVLGIDGTVYHKFSTPQVGTGWSNWDSLGQPAGVTVTGDVQVGVNSACNQELFVSGTDGTTYHSYSTPGQGSGWSAWSSLGQPAVGARGSVAVGQNGDGNQVLYVIGSDNAIYRNTATPGVGSGWAGWTSLGAPGSRITSSNVFVDTFPGEKLTVFTVAGEYVDSATPGIGSGWSDWSAVTAPCPTRAPSIEDASAYVVGASPAAACTQIAGPLALALTTIRTLESAGNYQAQSAVSTASGAYQFLDSTWNGYGGFPRACNAPPAVQDARAAAAVSAILAANGGDVGAIPVVWYLGHVPAPLSAEWDALPRGNRLTPRQYQAVWLALYRSL